MLPTSSAGSIIVSVCIHKGLTLLSALQDWAHIFLKQYTDTFYLIQSYTVRSYGAKLLLTIICPLGFVEFLNTRQSKFAGLVLINEEVLNLPEVILP